MSYAGTDAGLLKWLLFRLSIYAAVALASSILFLAGASVYALLHGPSGPVIDWAPPAPVQAPPIRLPGDLEMVRVPELQLTAEDTQLLLAVVKPPSFTRGRKYSLGDKIPGSNLSLALAPFLPDEVTKKVPRLRGFRYDNAHGVVLIVDPNTYRIVAIIGLVQEG
jgi:hypothetical protein